LLLSPFSKAKTYKLQTTPTTTATATATTTTTATTLQQGYI
jgi:hypothetical protein